MKLQLGGVSDLGLEQFLKQHPEIKNIHFATDNDEQGKKVLENVYNTDGTIKKVGYMQKYKDKGYEFFVKNRHIKILMRIYVHLWKSKHPYRRI